MFRSLNKGLECSVKLEKLIILCVAFFCKLDKGGKALLCLRKMGRTLVKFQLAGGEPEGYLTSVI